MRNLNLQQFIALTFLRYSADQHCLLHLIDFGNADLAEKTLLSTADEEITPPRPTQLFHQFRETHNRRSGSAGGRGFYSVRQCVLTVLVEPHPLKLSELVQVHRRPSPDNSLDWDKTVVLWSKEFYLANKLHEFPFDSEGETGQELPYGVVDTSEFLFTDGELCFGCDEWHIEFSHAFLD